MLNEQDELAVRYKTPEGSIYAYWHKHVLVVTRTTTSPLGAAGTGTKQYFGKRANKAWSDILDQLKVTK